MAKRLARTLQLHDPAVQRAVVTDRSDAELEALYDIVLPMQTSFGGGMAQKLNLDSYAPFHRTLYIDADCFVVRSLDRTWDLFDGVPFGACGRMRTEGEYFGTDLREIRERLGITGGVPAFNGGLLYFEDTPSGHAVFRRARDLADRYRELGFADVKGRHWSLSDEPCFGLAMALENLAIVPDGGSTMRTPIGMTGPLSIDVLQGYCTFIKEGEPVAPAVPHFPIPSTTASITSASR